MFFQWKSGDYIFRDMVPSYYVLKNLVNYRNYAIIYSNESVSRVPIEKCLVRAIQDNVYTFRRKA